MSKHYKHLSHSERHILYIMKQEGHSLRSIARSLARSVSTLSRELHRNRGGRDYRHQQAHALSVWRQQDKPRFRILTETLQAEYISCLQQGWSPEQIWGRRRQQQQTTVSVVTLYRWLHRDRQAGGSLFRFLCHKGRRYRYRNGSYDYRGTIPGRRGIEHRPPVVEERKYLGDWEADTMHGARHQGALVTVVERTSRLVLAAAVDHRDKVRVQQALVRLLHGVAKWVKTITFDNGREFSGHQFIAQQLHCHTYFARPYHSWERATNENTNGLLRRHFPKKHSLRGIAPTQVRQVVDQLNHRPRKCLGFRTPAEVFEELSGRDYNLATGVALAG